MTVVTTEVKAKGVNFLYSRMFIEKKYGREIWDGIVESMSPSTRDIWKQALLVSKDYPFEAYKEMTALLARVLKTAAKNAELAAIYEYVADQSLNTVYKVFFRFANPSYVLKNYPRLWSLFFSTGTVEVNVAEKGHAVLCFLLPEIFTDWLPAACLGYSKKAVEMAGGRNLTMQRVSQQKKGDDLRETVFELHWDE